MQRHVKILTEMVYQLGDFDRKRHHASDKFRRMTLDAFLEVMKSSSLMRA